MKILLRLATFALLVPLVNAADSATAPDTSVSVQVEWNPTETLPENALWLAYLTSRAAYIGDHKADYDQQPGIVTPLFAEEAAARTDVVQVYRELRQKDAKLKVAYFDDLVRVADHSFMSEYVWTYLYQLDWGTPPDKLRLVEFMNWRAKNLAQHSALTKGAIHLVGKDGAQKESAPAQSDAMPVLSRARDVLQRGDAQTAIAVYLDPVIEYFERLHQDSTTRFYAARNQKQVIVYVAAVYLDETYPERPTLLGGESMVVLTKFIDSWMWATAIRPWFSCYILDYHNLSLPQDQSYVRESRQTLFLGGRKLEDVQAGREERLPLVPPQLELLRQLLKQSPWLGGAQPNYADFRVLACFLWVASVATIPPLHDDDPLRDYLDRGFDLYGGLGRHPGMHTLFGLPKPIA